MIKKWIRQTVIGAAAMCLLLGISPSGFKPNKAEAVAWQSSMDTEYRNYHGLGWWSEPEPELRYAQAMGLKYVFFDRPYVEKIQNSPYKKNLKWYYNDFHKNVRPVSTMSLSAATLLDLKAKFPGTFEKWPAMNRGVNIQELRALKNYNLAVYNEIKSLYENVMAIADSSKEFPENMLGLNWGNGSFEPYYDFQQQSVITFMINQTKSEILQYDDTANNFLFAGLMIDVPEIYEEASYNSFTNGGTPVPGGKTHEYATYKDGWFDFLRQLKNALNTQFPSRSIKYIFEPYNPIAWVNDVNATSYNLADKKLIAGDYLAAESIQYDYIDPQITSTGLFASEDLGSSTPDFRPEAPYYVPYALPLIGEAGKNGRFVNWYGRPGPDPYSTSNAPHDNPIYMLPDMMKLSKVVANWDNINGVPLGSRSWNNVSLAYSSTMSRADQNVIYSRRPGTNMIYVNFLNSSGQVTLNAGESVAKVMRVNEFMEPTVSGASDLTVSGSTISINWSSAYDRKTYIIYTSSDNEILTNNSFENGTGSGWWYPSGPSVSLLDKYTYTGKALKDSSRTSSTAGITQDVTSGLSAAGMGQYTLSARVRMSTGSDTVKIGLTMTDLSGTVDFNTTGVTGTDWTTIYATLQSHGRDR
ncbi:carbohydrate binding domain-containing protein [Paenibacillus roseipurpureus]|uniref:Carbohydrate binding domain-containing protein n=1 Tax=Paenibacillus roseopurpureus TaxID=2918901 RepID=A0AA96RLX8_9BACL|nr:carbohydrate binding domain-containing protein [Paenibacillus sp. MBLB1832]WNR46145.1 carbohydrate binding domain-containing protein [Paenibacillus sp. MBLB1832]